MASYVADKLARHRAEEFLSPLLDDDATDASECSGNDGSAAGTVKRSPLEKLKATVAYGVVAGGVGLSAAAMVLAPHVAVYVMGGVCVANAPYAAYKEKAIAALPSLRSMNAKLSADAARLEAAVDDLAEEIDLLAPEAERAAEVEEELQGIASAQEVNVDVLVELVKENAVILAKMRDNLRQRIVQDITALVVASDRDNSQDITRREAYVLALRVKISLQEYGVLFDVDKFLRAIGGDTTVAAVIAIVRRLLPRERDGDGDGDDDADACPEDDDMYDMFHMMEEGSTTDGSGEGSQGVSLMTCDRRRSAAPRSEQLLRDSLPRMDDGRSQLVHGDY